MYQCICGRQFEKCQSYVAHCAHCKQRAEYMGRKPREASFLNKEGHAWNKGLTKYTDERVAKNVINRGLAVRGKPGHPMSDESRKRISESMKKAHAEGRAHNIGECRHNNEPSYPEKFFIDVIENEFDDKEYVREYPIGRYSADFAWIHLKKIIEIDGAQHERFESYRERDQKKDQLIHDKGWKVLRVRWSDMFNDPKKWIQICKDYIHQDKPDQESQVIDTEFES